jgi:hypothetical protein
MYMFPDASLSKKSLPVVPEYPPKLFAQGNVTGCAKADRIVKLNNSVNSERILIMV